MRAELNNSYSSVRGEDGYLIVLKEFSDYVYITVNGDGEETEEFLQRKLRVLHRIVTFLHGPCLEQLRPNKPRERNERWNMIGKLLLTWCDLYNSEQTFLVEAIERLHINEQVNKTCVELLEGALNGMKAAGEKHAVHAMLVTTTKLMALFSSRNATDLSHGDQLMLLLLVNNLFRGIQVTGTHSHLATLSSREIKKRPKLSRGPVNISRQDSKTPLLDTGDTGTSGTEDTTDSENLVGHSDSYTSSDDAGLGPNGRAVNDSSDLRPSPKPNGTVSPSEFLVPKNNCDTSNTTQRDLSPHQELEEEEPSAVNHSQGGTNPTHQVLTDSSRASSRRQSDSRSSSSSRRRSYHQKSVIKKSQSGSLLPPLSIVSKSGNTELGHQTDHQSSSSSFEHVTYQPSTERTSQQIDSGDKRKAREMSHDHHTQDRQSPKQPHFKHSLSTSFSHDSSHYSRTTPVVPELIGGRSASAFERSYNSGVITSGFGPVPELTVTENRNHDDSFCSVREEDVMDYDNPTVLLREGSCEFVPHSVHCVLVMEGVYLVIVCQLARVTHAQTISQALSTLTELLSSEGHAGTQPVKQLQDSMDTSVKRIGDILKKSKGVPQVERVIVDIGAKWDQAKQCDLVKTLSRPPQAGDHSGRLMGSLSVLQDKLCQLFQVLYLTKRRSSLEHQQSVLNGIGNIQGVIRRTLGDYRDYIGIMAHRNMPMSIYIDEFPGMVHFIFVNRTSNVMVAPSFHANLYADEDRTHQTSELVKQKVWEMYTWMRQRLAEGVFTVTIRETDFHFSYFVWFEDNQGGFPVALPQPTALSLSSSSTQRGASTSPPPGSPPPTPPHHHYPLPGVICEPFYTQLQGRCFPAAEKKNVSCYELFCVHVSMVPTQYALGHCRKLKEKLWKVSVDTSAPISLL